MTVPSSPERLNYVPEIVVLLTALAEPRCQAPRDVFVRDFDAARALRSGGALYRERGRHLAGGAPAAHLRRRAPNVNWDAAERGVEESCETIAQQETRSRVRRCFASAQSSSASRKARRVAGDSRPSDYRLSFTLGLLTAERLRYSA
jgi:hypothetical protein